MGFDNYVIYGTILLVMILILIRGKKLLGIVTQFLEPKTQGFLGHIASTALIQYTPTSKYEKMVEVVVTSFLSKAKTVLLAASAPRAEGYAKTFSDALNTERLTLVKISASPRTDRFYLTKETDKKDGGRNKIAEISVDWLEYLTELIEHLPKTSAIVFEPLSDLILINGFEKTFKFVKKTLDYCAGEEIQMVAFINYDAHEENVRASFEGLFSSIANVFGDEWKVVK